MSWIVAETQQTQNFVGLSHGRLAPIRPSLVLYINLALRDLQFNFHITSLLSLGCVVLLLATQAVTASKHWILVILAGINLIITKSIGFGKTFNFHFTVCFESDPGS